MTTVPTAQVSLAALCLANGAAAGGPYLASSLYGTSAFQGFLSSNQAPTPGAPLRVGVFRQATYGLPSSLFPFASPFTFRPLAVGNQGGFMPAFNADSTYAAQPWYPEHFRLWLPALSNANPDGTPIGGYQQWTVPKTGAYTITAVGARGGNVVERTGIGGMGAIISSTFTLQYSNTLLLCCGQRGGDGTADMAGGGGGSFVVTVNPATNRAVTPLLVAGGGGGAEKGYDGCHASNMSPVGNAGVKGWASFSNASAGGGQKMLQGTSLGGFGGATSVTSRGGPGGGYAQGAPGPLTNVTSGGGGTSYVATDHSGYGGSYTIGLEASDIYGSITITQN